MKTFLVCPFAIIEQSFFFFFCATHLVYKLEEKGLRETSASTIKGSGLHRYVYMVAAFGLAWLCSLKVSKNFHSWISVSLRKKRQKRAVDILFYFFLSTRPTVWYTAM